MRMKFTVMLVLLFVLAMTTMVNSQTMPKDFIYSVVIYVDGLSSNDLSSKALENNLMVEEGVAKVVVNPKMGIVIVTPKIDGNPISLFNLMNRINEVKEGQIHYVFTKMKVSAIGHVVKFPMEYISTAKAANVRDRYKLQIGEANIVLAKNNKLDMLVRSGYEQAMVSGVVTAFSDTVPIMVISDFKEPGKDSTMKLVPAPKESISSVKIYVDGLNDKNLPIESLKSNIMTEEGAAKITIDQKNGAVIITPKSSGNQLSLYNLSKRINETRQGSSKYNVILIKVEAIGHVINPSGETEGADEQETSRIQEVHRLQIGDLYFNLTENDKLEELLSSGLDTVDVNGTVVRFNNTAPVIEIDSFDNAAGESTLDIGPEPLDEMAGSLEKEKETLHIAKHSQIDSIRLYMSDAITPDFADAVKADMSKDPGVQNVIVDSNTGVIEISPKYGTPIDLYNVWHHIDMLQGYKIIKADVVASGDVTKLQGGYQASLSHPQLYQQYMLTAGSFIGFILSPNKVLNDMLDSKTNPVSVIGTVTNFRERTPILDIKNFQKLEQRPDWMK